MLFFNAVNLRLLHHSQTNLAIQATAANSADAANNDPNEPFASPIKGRNPPSGKLDSRLLESVAQGRRMTASYKIFNIVLYWWVAMVAIMKNYNKKIKILYPLPSAFKSLVLSPIRKNSPSRVLDCLGLS